MKKILGVFLLFTFLLGTGTIYASVNPGKYLSDWYKNSFLKESEKLGAATATGLIVVLKEVDAFLEVSKESIDDTLAIFLGDKVKDANTGDIRSVSDRNDKKFE